MMDIVPFLMEAVKNTAQFVFIAVLSGAVKLYFDVRDLKKDMNFAFCKIRSLENKKKE